MSQCVRQRFGILTSCAGEEPAEALQRLGRSGAKSMPVPLSAYTDVPNGRGVKVYDVVVGRGQMAKAGDRVVIHFDAHILGKKLTVASSRVGLGVTGGVPYGFDLGTPGGTSGGPFLQGINIGTEGMLVGGQRRVIIPPELAYGNQQVQEIPPNATLEFEIELLSIAQTLPKPTLF